MEVAADCIEQFGFRAFLHHMDDRLFLRRLTRELLLSLEEKIDTSSAAGELIFHVFGAIAHFERRLISERTKDGIAAARAKGKLPGRQPLDIKKVEAAIKLIEAKTSPAEAARQLGLGRSTVYREMRRLGIQRPA
jgi:DNA invertase Pin-like site-specific DNA recombinase